jgi:thiol-disulfide isomerase/thioredoxin
MLPRYLCLLLCACLAADASSSDKSARAALADLKRDRQEVVARGVGSAERMSEINDTVFSRVNLDALTPSEIAELVRWNAFSYSSDSDARAKRVAQRLEAFTSTPDLDGALASALRVLLSAKAGIKGPERSALVTATLNHPFFKALVQSEHADLAIETACRVGMRDATHRDFILGLAGKLDATKSTSAAVAIGDYWQKIQQAIPEGEARQNARRQLVDYLSAVLARSDSELTPTDRARLEAVVTRMSSALARGEKLEGRTAPELHFAWTSEGSWKSLSDLRGKIVLLDFWATWCAPCVASFPKVAKLVEHYRDSDVVVVGVTSIQGSIAGLESKSIDCRGDPEKEMRLMADYIKAKNITWPVVFSREPLMNPEYGIDAVPTLALIAPDGTVRHIRAGFDGLALTAQIDAILKEFQKQPAAD